MSKKKRARALFEGLDLDLQKEIADDRQTVETLTFRFSAGNFCSMTTPQTDRQTRAVTRLTDDPHSLSQNSSISEFTIDAMCGDGQWKERE
jgi:hypothetical protein